MVLLQHVQRFYLLGTDVLNPVKRNKVSTRNVYLFIVVTFSTLRPDIGQYSAIVRNPGTCPDVTSQSCVIPSNAVASCERAAERRPGSRGGGGGGKPQPEPRDGAPRSGG